MASSTTIYKCDYCDFTTKSKAAITKHETTCTSNPNRPSLIDDKIETIRQTAENIPHLLKLLVEFWESYGLKVTFTSYPYQWSDKVSNSHTSPKGYPTNWCGKNADTPTSYPGWQGRWEGTVTKLPNYKGKADKPSADEAFGGSFSKDAIKIPFIHTGSGSGGSKFGYSGMLFLYDFPLMHEQWKSEQGEYKLLGEQYTAKIKALTDEVKQRRNEYIANQPETHELNQLETQMQQLRTALTVSRTILTTHYTNEFAKANPIDIPEIPSAFIDNKAYENLANLNLFVDSAKPEVASLFKQTAELAEKLATYPAKYPEYFI